jgi:protein-S-isoprenylcysteine O-methyltransferase Ste14
LPKEIVSVNFEGLELSVWFCVSLFGFVGIVLPYFLSLEHLKLEEKYGKQKGKKLGEIFGLISGWGFFLFWFGIWLSPQERFIIPIFQNFSIQIPILNLTIYLINLLLFIPFFVVGAWFGVAGVISTSLKVAETHRAETVVSTGVYSIVRHPQYLGGILAHIGFSFLLSGLYSLVVTPLAIAIIYIISWKEENELTKEFGQKYAEYRSKVPMLIPKFNVRKS